MQNSPNDDKGFAATGRPPVGSPLPPASGTGAAIDVRALLGPAREAILVHNGEHYRLRVTANNKLILTK
ncbi:hemin uptake protein HemP [Rhabdaerophilum calidifontis]|uniref:hemin uptake protein HemP n=1 Tax=Rhabdaerophilum calidifontis TaxID=2604328 RepID=UPI00123C78E8|nr:hemin uptake protein HemP [Rhabdaerophilum calidifontis]